MPVSLTGLSFREDEVPFEWTYLRDLLEIVATQREHLESDNSYSSQE